MKIFSIIRSYKDSPEKNQCMALSKSLVFARQIKAAFTSYDRSHNKFLGSTYKIVETEVDDSLADIFSRIESNS